MMKDYHKDEFFKIKKTKEDYISYLEDNHITNRIY